MPFEYLLLLAQLGLLGVTLLNLISYRKLTAGPRQTPAQRQSGSNPLVSILIPIRNEEQRIGATIEALLQQRMPDFELLILDDDSSDASAAVVASFQKDKRLTLLTGNPLPPGWTGKNWACHQLAAESQADTLLFCDADVHFEPDAVEAILAAQQQIRCGLLAVWPTQKTISWGERLIVPLMAFSRYAYLPLILVHRTRFAAAAAANGQCILVTRKAYAASGGHSDVRDQVLDDVALARAAKHAGVRVYMVNAGGLVCCRMYHNWRETSDGYAKSILSGHNQSIVLLLLSSLIHVTLFVLPWWLLGRELIAQGATTRTAIPLTLCLLPLLIRAVSAAATEQRTSDALFFPLSVLLMTYIAFQSIYQQLRYGGPRWKDRRLKQGRKSTSTPDRPADPSDHQC